MTRSLDRKASVLAPVTRPLFEVFARCVLRAWCRLRVEGRENLPPLPFLLCSNHNSHMDSVALLAAAGYPFERFAMLAAADYFFCNAFRFQWFSSLLQLIPLERTPSAQAMQKTVSLCRTLIEDGAHGLILFPEGTRSRSGSIGPFHRGVSFFASELGIPVVPAHITGTRRAMPVGALFPRPASVLVRFARPVFPADSAAARRDHLLDEMRQRIFSLEANSRHA